MMTRLTYPAFAISAAVTAMVSFVLFTSVVARLTPATCTTELALKPVPFNVKVKPAPPAITGDGSMLVKVGSGLLMVKLRALVVPPPGAGLLTVTLAVPAAKTSAAVIAAVNCVALTNVVVRAPPFHCTIEVLLKFAPLTVSGNAALPAIAAVGLRLVKVGTGLLMAIFNGVEESGAGNNDASAATTSMPTG